MTRENLKNGMIGIFKEDGVEYLTIYLDNTFISYNSHGGASVHEGKLEQIKGLQKVIKSTYNLFYNADLNFWMKQKKFLEYPYEIIWEKPKPKEMTLEQVCEALGEEIKIVK